MSAQNNHSHTMSNGLKIPAFGLGTFAGDRLEDVVKTGIDIGYRLIDTAFIYNNEDAIGKGLKKVFKENKIKREELFIVSKLWNTQHKPADVLPAIKRSLNDLQLDYLDLYLMHWPFAQKTNNRNEYEIFSSHEDPTVTFEDTWIAMEKLVKQGYTKSIGLSNFNSVQIDRILKIATIKPVVNQVECNPYLSQEKLREFCKQRDILIMAYSPLYAPGRYCSDDGLDLFKEPIIKECAHKYKKNAAQIILKYLVQCGVIPIPKTDKTDRLKSNFDIWNFTIAPNDFEKLRSLNKNTRCSDYGQMAKAKEYPFKIEF